MPALKRFLVIDDYSVIHHLDNETFIPKCVWVLDYEWFNTVDKEITEWLNQHKCIMPGMLVKFPDEQTMSMFLLRWS